MDGQLTQIERKALTMLLAGDHKILETLREQLAASTVITREIHTGFLTTFVVADHAPIVPGAKGFVIGDVYGELEELEHPVGFILFVRGGKLEMLECYINDEAWPATATLKRLYFLREQPHHDGNGADLVESADRDLTALQRRFDGR